MRRSDLPAVHRILRRAYLAHKAPIVELVQARTRDPFKVLVATILSARTKDEMTADVSQRLFKVVRKPDDFRKLTQRQLEKLIFPIGFFRTKARHLRQLPAVLEERFGGRIPDTIEELCELPGVGRKTANIVRSVAFDKPAVCVDVHVHRISNRFGLVRTNTPLETERRLRKVLPVRYWKTWNRYLVSYGQTVCTPRRPRCSRCRLYRYCARVGAGSSGPTAGSTTGTGAAAGEAEESRCSAAIAHLPEPYRSAEAAIVTGPVRRQGPGSSADLHTSVQARWDMAAYRWKAISVSAAMG